MFRYFSPMKLHTRWTETRFGIFRRRTEFELYCRVELSKIEMPAYAAAELGNEIVCQYRSHGLVMDTRLASLVAGETRFGSEDRAYLEDIEKSVAEAVERLTARLQDHVPVQGSRDKPGDG